MAEIVIIGAGLTGLSVAYHLEQFGFNDYALYEASNRVGGLAKSETVNGFTFDYTGHFLHLATDYGKSLFSTLDPCDYQLHQRQAAIFSHSRYVPYPFQAHLYGLPVDVISECIEGFVTRNKRSKPATFHSWVMHYFGKGLGKHFFFPYNEKLFDYPPKKIHHAWTSRFIPQVSLASLLQGALSPQQQAMGYNNSFYYPQSGGIEQLPKCLEKKLKNPVFCEHKVVLIDQQSKKIIFSNGRSETYRFLVSTMPLDHFLGHCLPLYNNPLHDIKRKLLCTSVLCINLGLKIDLPLYHWIYYPDKRFTFYRLGFWHTVNKSLVPYGYKALFAEIGFKSNTQPSITHLVDKTISELGKLFNFTQNDIVLYKNLLLDRAYVIYDVWRQQHIDKLLGQLIASDIYSVGRYGAWKYASMEEALLDGHKVALKILRKK